RAVPHLQALAQCDRYLHSRQIKPVAFHDTAGAARAVAEQRKPGTAAIASKAAAIRYGLYVLAESIQDDSENRTRFVVVEKGAPTRPRDAQSGWKGSIAFVTAPRPGTLRVRGHPPRWRGRERRPLRGRPPPGRSFLSGCPSPRPSPLGGEGA